MDKKLHFKSLLFIVALLLGGENSVWAGEAVYKSLTFTANDKTKVGNYASSWEETVNETSWTIANFNNNNWGWTSEDALKLIKCGRKKSGSNNTPSIATITTNTAIDQAITKVVVTLTAINTGDYNSIKLYVASNDAFSENLTTIAVDQIPLSAGEMTITIPEANRAEGCYYKIEFDTKGSTSSNGHTGVTKVDYYIYQASSKTETSLEWSADSYSFYQGEDYTLPTLTPTPAAISGDVTYESSNTAVATVATDGTVTIKGAGSTTITAKYAGNDTYEEAADASYILNVKGSCATMAELQALCAAYGTTAMKAKVTLSDVIVTAVKGSNAYISDGTNGAVIYKKDNGFNAGDKLSCTNLEMTIMNYNGFTPEITSLTSTTEGLTVTAGQTITPKGMNVDAIMEANFGTVVKISNVTYSHEDKTFKDADNHSIAFYDNFTASPTLNDGEEYDVTGVIIIKNSTTLEICPRTAGDVVAKTVKIAPASAWKSGDAEIESVAVTTGETLSVTFDTNSTGDKSFESDNEAVATVSNAGVITLTGTIGKATITGTTAANDSYYASSASLTLIVGKPVEDGVFNFANYQDYGSGIVPTSAIEYVEEEKTWTAGNVTLKTNGKYRWYIPTEGANTGIPDFRIYGKDEPYSYMTVSVPDDYYITSIKGVSTLTPSTGTVKSGTWTGMAQSVTFTYESTSSSKTITQLDVTYSTPTVKVAIGDNYTTFCYASPVSFNTEVVKVYKAKVSSGSVHLTEVTDGKVPAGKGVILKAATAGDYTATVVEPVENLDNNELKGVTVDTQVKYAEDETTDYRNYILQGGEFKKATEEGATLRAGRAYLHTKFDVTATTESRLTIVVDGETTGIKTVKGDSDEQGVYDLQGRKVAQPAKGLYITNGKKFIVK